jgi:hypothetical protein
MGDPAHESGREGAAEVGGTERHPRTGRSVPPEPPAATRTAAIRTALSHGPPCLALILVVPRYFRWPCAWTRAGARRGGVPPPDEAQRASPACPSARLSVRSLTHLAHPPAGNPKTRVRPSSSLRNGRGLRPRRAAGRRPSLRQRAYAPARLRTSAPRCRHRFSVHPFPAIQNSGKPKKDSLSQNRQSICNYIFINKLYQIHVALSHDFEILSLKIH